MTRTSVSRRKAKTSRPAKRKRQKFVLIGQYRYPIVGGLMEIEGHLLNPDQVEVLRRSYLRHRDIAGQPGSNVRYPAEYAEQRALGEVLWDRRSTPKARDRLLDLSMKLNSISLAIGEMRGYSFTGGDAVSSQAGCTLLTTLVEEAERRLFKIKHFASSMALEPTTKLQDWTKREAEFEQLGGTQS